jgi:thiamine-monophosphate kinase
MSMTEFELIERLRGLMPTNASTRVGAGDDCAVLDLGLADRWVLLKTDAVVEGVHFDAESDPVWIGHKALARCLSDVAAMGGAPGHAVVTLGLPSKFDPGRVEGVYRGMKPLAQRHGVAIVGGEITSNPDRLLISVAVLGTVGRGRCPLRSGARVGDELFVTGELGGSLESGRHMRFEPRLIEARWLVEHFEIHAMIDLSDGLAGDLRHVLTASGVGAEIVAEAIPIHPAVQANATAGAESRMANSPLRRALGDGEDYELLFAVAGDEAVRLAEPWKRQFPELRLSRIGKVIPGKEVLLREGRELQPLTLDGYKHF